MQKDDPQDELKVDQKDDFEEDYKVDSREKAPEEDALEHYSDDDSLDDTFGKLIS